MQKIMISLCMLFVGEQWYYASVCLIGSNTQRLLQV
jgi:hypothetical protein